MVNLSHPRETDKIVPTIAEKAGRDEQDAIVKVYPPANNSIRETDSIEGRGDPTEKTITEAEGKHFRYPNAPE